MHKTFPSLDSLEQAAASLPEHMIDQILAGLDEELALLQWSWEWTARADQLAATDDNARVIGIIAGRGGGKTRTGAEWVRRRVGRGHKVRFAFVGRTAADVRDTMVQGESGVLSVFPPSEAPKYTPTARRVDFVDGSEALCFTAEVPGQIRGPQFHYSWADELAAWDLRPDDSGANAWDNLQFATRLGRRQGIKSQIIFTTTPKRIKMLREIIAKGKTDREWSIYNQASTFDNVHNLDPEAVRFLLDLYEGTALAGQELQGVLSDEVEGALWTEELIGNHRTYDDPGKLPIRVVGVDPSTADNPKDECGIVVCGAAPKTATPLKRYGYVLEDASLYGAPKVWAKRVVEMAKKYDAPVRAEANQGGAMVREVIHNIDPSISVELVTASVSKFARAEPLAMATAQGRLKFFRRFPELEDQMTTWVPIENRKDESPDRIDALVHALAGVITLKKKSTRTGGTTRVSNPGKGRSLNINTRA